MCGIASMIMLFVEERKMNLLTKLPSVDLSVFLKERALR